MKIQTFSVVVGTEACNAHCQFCISHITGFDQLPEIKSINFRNFRKAIDLAKLGGTTTLLFTGKGEPLLYPDEISSYMSEISRDNPFPFIELQTNAIIVGEMIQKQLKGIKLTDKEKALEGSLKLWHFLGMTTIAISVIDVENDKNKQCYLHHRNIEYPDLGETVKYLHSLGYSIRLCVMMQRGMVETFEDVQRCAKWCKANNIAQMTIRPIRRTEGELTSKEGLFVLNNGLSQAAENAIRSGLKTEGTHILTLMNGAHEAKIYDLNGQNVCLADCLTVEPTSDAIRTLIFFSDGKLCYDWAYPGARLL